MGSNPNASDRRTAGRIGEAVAATFLQKKGYTIVARNYLRPWGEIDIIAVKSGAVRFVEVKTVTRDTITDVSRESNTYRPEEQVHPRKLSRIIRTAESYMVATNDLREYQIDVVGVFLDMTNRKARCRLFEQVI
jgi:putative endonuclease